MAKVAITEQYLQDIANAIRAKTGSSTATYLPSEMSSAIRTIGGGGITPSGTISITDNGEYDVTTYSGASVNVPTGSTINNQNKTVTPTESEQVITYDTGYTGLNNVTVGAISSNYIGSQVVQRSSSDLTVSGSTITAPSGYYNTFASKSVGMMTLPTSPTSAEISGYTKKATVSRSTSAQYINIDSGYNTSGGYYEISPVPNGSAAGPTTLTGTGATIITGNNTLSFSKTGIVTTPTVTAGYIESGTSSTATVTLSASVTTKSAATIMPTTTSQQISAGTYLTGTQTISGDANLIASNIVSGKSIFGVSGNVVLQNYYTGSTAPATSLGNNGDLYLQV